MLYCSVSRAHLSDSGARQSAKDAGAVSLDLSLCRPLPARPFPRCGETLFLGARSLLPLSRKGSRPHDGQVPKPRLHTRMSGCTHRLTRVRSCAHEPLRKSSLDAADSRLLPPSKLLRDLRVSWRDSAMKSRDPAISLADRDEMSKPDRIISTDRKLVHE